MSRRIPRRSGTRVRWSDANAREDRHYRTQRTADPFWPEQMAGRDGRPLPTAAFRQGPHWRRRWSLPEEVVYDEQQRAKDLARHRRQFSTLLARYRRELTPKQYEVVDMLMLRGHSLRECADALGVTATAIFYRISSLRLPAPEFWRWWRRYGSRGIRYECPGLSDDVPQ
jgi:DNA-directed RNA polymerase specialized sigma24 family protein